MSDRLVIIPTYNEKENVRKIVEAVVALPMEFDILIIDDGSPDGTAEEVKRMMDELPVRLFLVEREKKMGLGTAYIYGFRWGLDRDYNYFFEMDADFSHPPEALTRLYESCANQGADVAVGSRYVSGGGVKNWPFNRRFLSFGASMYVRMITWMPVKDPTAGFVCYKREVLEALDLDKIEFVGYAFQIEMKFKSRLKGFRIAEVPIIFTDREFGESKMSSGIIKEAIVGVLKLKYDSLFRRRRKKSSPSVSGNELANSSVDK